MYQSLHRWVTGQTSFNSFFNTVYCKGKNEESWTRIYRIRPCSHLYVYWGYTADCFCNCHEPIENLQLYFICEEPKKNITYDTIKVTRLNTSFDSENDSHVELYSENNIVFCEKKHTTKDFLSCEIESDCDVSEAQTVCYTGVLQVPMFQCGGSGLHTVHYTHVCDFAQHCPNDHDEEICEYPSCKIGEMSCGNGQCVPLYKVGIL